ASSTTDNRIILTADQTWTVNNPTANLVVKRPVEGAFTLIKSGAGTLQFSATTGTMTVGTGTASITGQSRFNGTLDIRQGGVRLDQANEFTSPDANIVVNTGNDATLSASSGIDQTINGKLFLGGTGSLLFSGTGSFTFNAPTILLTDKTVSQGAGRAAIFNGSITGTGGLSKGGGGTFLFNGTNTYGGNTTV